MKNISPYYGAKFKKIKSLVTDWYAMTRLKDDVFEGKKTVPFVFCGVLKLVHSKRDTSRPKIL